MRERAIEEVVAVSDGEPVLHAAEAQHVNAGSPREIGRRASEPRHRVGKTGAVHVHLEAVLACGPRQCPEFRGRVERAEFRCLREGQHGGLHVMRPGIAHRQHFHRLRRQLGKRCVGGHQLRPAAEELGRACFVRLDVRKRVPDHGIVGPAELCQHKRIGRRTVEHEKHVAFGLEQRGDARPRLLSPGIITVADGMTRTVGLDEAGQSWRTNPGVVVGGELLAHV